jgi:hypothetical protein
MHVMKVKLRKKHAAFFQFLYFLNHIAGQAFYVVRIASAFVVELIASKKGLSTSRIVPL